MMIYVCVNSVLYFRNEKLLNSTGRDLRRILFSLKQIFQDDKDLVHEFVQNDGLACLIKVGAEADQNYQNYILRALGQVMLYVDGMNGVIAHNETIQWLYSLLGSQFRLVVKTALKLLLVFVKYTESNSLLLLAAVYIVDRERGVPPWSHVMGILNDKDCGDTELLVYAMTLLNRSLNGVPDQDTYYDIVDALEEQGMEATVRHLQSLRSRELSEQCRMYEAMLDKEDSEEVATSNGGITTKRAGTRTGHNSGDRRSSGVREKVQPDQEVTCRVKKLASNLENAETEPKTAGLSEKKKLSMDLLYKNNSNSINNNNNNVPEEIQPTNGERSESQKALPSRPVLAPPPALPDLSSLDSAVEQPKQRIGAVHSLAVKYQQQQKPDVEPSPAGSKVEPTAANDDESSAQPGGGGGDTFANALSRARKGMEKKLAAREAIDTRKESEIQWEKALQNLNRPLIVNDLDFTELNDADDQDPLRLVRAQEMSAAGGGVDSLSRPPPPPLFAQTLGSIPGPPPPPPPQAASTGGPPPPPPVAKQESGMGHRSSMASRADRVDSKTVKLHWKEAQCKPLPGVLDKDGGIFWQKVKPVAIDTEKLGNLFVTKTKELAPKKKDDKKLEIRVLDTKRSNAINIGLTKLPPPRAIKTAVLKFDSSIMNKECIEKVLSTMMPTAEEQEAIAGAQAANPDLPLGSAEQFLLMLSEIPQLHARLRLWLFMLDYANVEREVAEPLMDLKLAMEELDKSRTFKQVMATLLAVGNFLNGAEVRGFQIDYLAKVPEVKDTVHKHSLVYHLASIVLESFPDSTDLYSEMGAVARSAKVDFDEVKANLEKLEKDCKSSWDYLRVVAKHESHSLKEKISGFLTDCAQRILTLKIIHKRVINRFRKFLLYMGMPQPAIKDTKINTICKTISEFALEYRTCREKILQQKKRLQDKRERNKTRGKLITDAKSWTQRNNPTNSSSTAENANAQKNHEELSKVLKSTGNADASWNLSYPGSRTRQKITQPTAAEVRSTMGEAAESPDDEILDGLVKAATTTGDHPREYRRRARQFNRKSLRRTRTLKLVDDQINGTSNDFCQSGSTVKQLNETVVHQISFGQVISCMTNAIKELVENALDAGATAIDITLTNSGIERIHVADNGTGIPEKDFQNICKSHCTSKLSVMDDLSRMKTFGFRGEALCALCLIGDVIITTRHADSELAFQLHFDRSGQLTKQVACSRQIGTTVEVAEIFHPFPVRRKSLIRSVQKEWPKLMHMLQSYALLPSALRLQVVNKQKGGKQSVAFSALSSENLRENICSVFDVGQLRLLMEFVQILPNEETLEQYLVKNFDPAEIDKIKIVGFVSSVQQGRSSGDRQFTYVNNRPCEIRKITQLVNEVYHQFNPVQYPVFVLYINVPTEMLDVNCTPDKRLVYISRENLLLAILRHSLTEMYGQSSVIMSCSSRWKTLDTPQIEDATVSDVIGNIAASDNNLSADCSSCSTAGGSSSNKVNLVRGVKRLSSRNCRQDHQLVPIRTSDILEAFGFKSKEKKSRRHKKEGQRLYGAEDGGNGWQQGGIDTVQLVGSTSGESGMRISCCEPLDDEAAVKNFSHGTADCTRTVQESLPLVVHSTTDQAAKFKPTADPRVTIPAATMEVISGQQLSTCGKSESAEMEVSKSVECVSSRGGVCIARRYYDLQVNWDDLEIRLLGLIKTFGNNNKCAKTSFNDMNNKKFQIHVDPAKDAQAEEEVKRFLTRDMFAEMHVIGQFNCGFILTRLDDDLFILDQHASDEKRTFETMRRSTVVQSQLLVQYDHPICSNLTPFDRHVILENLETFKNLGYTFQFPPEGSDEPVKIVSLPVCHGQIFDQRDFDEMISKLSQFPGNLCMPTKIRSILASRACRKSVMIGTALSMEEMQQIVERLSSIEHPWNCPHGRPTVRHLINLATF
ncbi:FH1/FH2 domain-containing protein 3 [Trichinella patagoniensis]|uniref:FH1/FH2 domain-containing protein 3 n=1 Tax=Trichinella patagoniensis TaxID=990121 RepID=A0A0V0Z714_9BILA|nr:FH1/FH2 domain-containing protein 3 [Trichinella patagoniensis]